MLALLYDVHGNLPALEAVLEDCPADHFLLGGDYAAFGGWPRECVERLQSLDDATWIRGNTERWLVDGPPEGGPAEAIETTAALVDVDWLYALPERITLTEGHFCHASPLNDMESFAPEEQPGEDRLLDGVAERRVVFGHTHVQFRRVREDGIELVNPGSVGIPLDGDRRAAYAVIGDDGELELRRVEYDVERAAAKADEPYRSRILTARL
jgi:diadenosine tetraphosphatase ApaH/serine/threonine PP2A family protein phosphatase